MFENIIGTPLRIKCPNCNRTIMIVDETSKFQCLPLFCRQCYTFVRANLNGKTRKLEVQDVTHLKHNGRMI